MQERMIVIGLTGGIGMGKSAVATMMARMGLPIYSADDAVHQLLGKGGGAVAAIGRKFPTAIKNGAVDRKALGALVFGNPEELKKLESILHPIVRKDEERFIKRSAKTKCRAVVLEIPLLFETGADVLCDFVITVTAPRAVQKARVLKRKGMTAARFNKIAKHQMPDRERTRLADFVLPTDGTHAVTRSALMAILKGIGVLR